MALRDEDWLPRAKRLAVGMRMRVHHKNERRPNMTIGNERDRYWAYCQACKQGARIDKEHVLLAAHYETEQRRLEVPTDMVRAEGSDWEATAGRFLASKGMMYPYLPELFVSPSTGRLLLCDDTGQWHGRDLTERSNQKWLHYGAQFSGNPGRLTILTEDLFSMYKVRYALRGWPTAENPGVRVCSTLGASCGPVAALALHECDSLLWFYDGDKAGDEGRTQALRRMRPYIGRQMWARPPDGMDPKDMQCEEIRDLIRRTVYALAYSG